MNGSSFVNSYGEASPSARIRSNASWMISSCAIGLCGYGVGTHEGKEAEAVEDFGGVVCAEGGDEGLTGGGGEESL